MFHFNDRKRSLVPIKRTAAAKYRSDPSVIEYATFFTVENSYGASRFLAEPFKYSCLLGRGATLALESPPSMHSHPTRSESKFKVFVENRVETAFKRNVVSFLFEPKRCFWVNNKRRLANIQPTLARSRELQSKEYNERDRKR